MRQNAKNAKKKQKCKKKAGMEKKAENARLISKLMQKRQKIHFQFRSSYKIKNGRKKAHLFGFVSLLYTLCIFLHFKPKNSYKKRQKMQKKAKIFFQIRKIHMQKKKQKIIFQKNMQKKAEMQKKS